MKKTKKMTDEMIVETEFSQYRHCYLNINRYLYGNHPLAIRIENTRDGAIATITKCLQGYILSDNESFVDTNNCPWAVDFIKRYGLGEPTDRYGESGYCRYPLYKFNMVQLERYSG